MPTKSSEAATGLRLREGARLKRSTAGYLGTIGDPTGAHFERQEAEDMETRADEILTLPAKPDIGTGGELQLSKADAATLPGLACTVDDPTRVTMEASRDRLELTSGAQCLAMAADAAETIQAQNSLEKMLAHQMAAAHAASMRLIARAETELSQCQLQGADARQNAQLSATRLFNTSARLMASFQDGIATLHKLRHGGKQTVTVQHVQVSEGGQAVVAGSVNGTGGSRTGGDGEI